LAYVVEGVAGLPFFAGGGSGPVHLFGPSGGYLIGFIVAALVVGRLLERVDRTSLVTIATAMIGGTAVIFACGLAQLALFVEPHQLLMSGLVPFLPGAAIKIALASVAVRATVSERDR
jgi:biotin transport system substrate-specific component